VWLADRRRFVGADERRRSRARAPWRLLGRLELFDVLLQFLEAGPADQAEADHLPFS